MLIRHKNYILSLCCAIALVVMVFCLITFLMGVLKGVAIAPMKDSFSQVIQNLVIVFIQSTQFPVISSWWSFANVIDLNNFQLSSVIIYAILFVVAAIANVELKKLKNKYNAVNADLEYESMKKAEIQHRKLNEMKKRRKKEGVV